MATRWVGWETRTLGSTSLSVAASLPRELSSNNNYYIAPIGAALEDFSFDTSTNMLNTGPVSSSPTSYGFPGATPSVSAEALRTESCGRWITRTTARPSLLVADRRCFMPTTRTSLSTELWNSGMVAGDAAGNAVKFTVPTVANGKVYVGTRGNNIRRSRQLDHRSRRTGCLRAEAELKAEFPVRATKCRSSKIMNAKTMTVAGIMSGTSADGIDVAVVRIAPGKSGRSSRCWRMRALLSAALRRAVLAAMNAASTSTAELARLNWRLGMAYAEAVKATLEAAHGEARPDWLPRADALSSAAGGDLCGPALRLHLAGWRGAGDCRGDWGSGGFELSARGYARRRPGRAAGSAAGLCALCRPKAGTRAAEHRRHRQPDGDSRRSARRIE